MTALSFTLTSAPQQRVDVGSLTPDALAGKTLDEIAAITLHTGNRELRVDEVFSVSGDDTDSLVFAGAGTGKLDQVGLEMTRGAIRVEGDAGSYVAMRMKGGTLRVNGSVDAYAACELKNGLVTIGGNAGDFLGACLPGNKKGMAGGIVVVKGNAGDRVGDHQRRGIILIEGNAGNYLGSRMTAGTIAVLGQVGAHIGYAMGRGTLLLAQAPAQLPTTFHDCGTHTLGFIPLLLKGLGNIDTPFTGMGETLKRVRRYAGDMCHLGKGEILIAQ